MGGLIASTVIGRLSFGIRWINVKRVTSNYFDDTNKNILL